VARRSTIRQRGLPPRAALIQKWDNGCTALLDGGLAGAARLANGAARRVERRLKSIVRLG